MRYPYDRRRFLKKAGSALTVLGAEPALRAAVGELLGSRDAWAQTPEIADADDTLFIEWNLRDQWCHGQAFVAPGLATYADLIRGPNGDQCALYFRMNDLTAYPGDFYLTPQSRILAPHLDSIAVMDLGELCIGVIHGHEAGNALRSPGRSKRQGNGRMPMFNNDPTTKTGGNDLLYSSVPTPATMHNYVQRTLRPELQSGLTLKGVSRSIHTVYHFAAGLPGAELDRIRSRDQLLELFPETTINRSILPTEEEASVLERVIRKADGRFLGRRNLRAELVEAHRAELSQIPGRLYAGASEPISLRLTPEETAYWRDGVPSHANPNVLAQVWEQAAWAHKILASGRAKTVSLEFDYVDVHGSRSEGVMSTMTNQFCPTFARLIEQLKASGLYERTVIAVYTTDGSRSPAGDSYGNEGKNTLILAGGRIRGGYYGDIRIDGRLNDGHRYRYHPPDELGRPGPGFTNNDGRISGAMAWRTVMKALGIPDRVLDPFSEVRGVRPMDFMLRV